MQKPVASFLMAMGALAMTSLQPLIIASLKRSRSQVMRNGIIPRPMLRRGDCM
jgi:hypothetical protein